MKKKMKEMGERRSPRRRQTGKIGGYAKNRLRTMCDGLSPRKRLVAVIISLTVFAVMAVYMAVSSMYYRQRPELNIRHIEGIKLQRANNDSIHHLKFRNHDESDE